MLLANYKSFLEQFGQLIPLSDCMCAYRALVEEKRVTKEKRDAATVIEREKREGKG